MEIRGTLKPPGRRRLTEKQRRVGKYRRLEYKRPLCDVTGAVVGYLDRWGNPWVIRYRLSDGDWEWKEVYHGP